MSMINDYIMDTIDISEQSKNEIYYNCTECSSSIEILSIDENECIIEFQCINNNHKKKMLINEYINQMKKFNNNEINSDICINHNLKYECYCLDCNVHLCKACLQLREHINHTKNNIIEIMPNKEEIRIFENILKYYKTKKEELEFEKINKTKELTKKLEEYKNKLKERKQLKIDENKNKKELELKKIKEEYINYIKDIKNKYDKALKLKTYNYTLKINQINNKYKLINEYNNITYNKNLEKIDIIYINQIKKYEYGTKIDNVNNLKRLNEIVYNTYINYNNNYYNSINFNNILLNHKNSEIYNELSYYIYIIY